MRRYKVKWRERHEAEVTAANDVEAVRDSGLESRFVKSCQDQYDFVVEDL